MFKKVTKNKIEFKKGFMLKQALLGIFDAMVILTIGFAGALFFLFTTVPSGDLKANWKPAQTTVIYDSSGQHILYEIYGEENRKIVTHQGISDNLRKMTVATEDDSFYAHKGFDIKSIIRALKVNLQKDHISQGGSTITQQLARNVYLTREKTIKRKVKEVLIAIKIERNNSKQDILDYYLNAVPYGANAYGAETAAQIYLGKSASELSLDEAALLAALPKAPTYYSPYGEHKNELLVRQQGILQRAADLGLVTQEEAVAAKREDTLTKVRYFQNKIEAPHFIFYVIEELEKEYGRDFLQKAGFKVITTLDYDLQKTGEKIVEDGVNNNVKKYGGSNAALVAVNPKTGGILTMVGSKDYFATDIDGQVNVATRLRQPGSSIKPIIYATAFENGYQPETRITDASTNFGPDGSGRPYIPRNYSGTFRGNVSMRQALAMSLNIPAVKTLNAVGIDVAINMAERLGIDTFTERQRYGLSLAIGGAEVTLLKETGAYAVFANDGIRQNVNSINRIIDSNGNVKYAIDITNGQRVIDQEVARKVSSILSDNDARMPVFGSRSPVFIEGKKVAAKTGTTQEFRDAWTVGFVPSLAAGVWTGNNNNAPMKGGADGVFVAAPIWHSFMVKALEKIPEESFIAYNPVNKDAVKNVDEGTEKEILEASLPADMKHRNNIISDKRPSGWSKKEWSAYRKTLGL